MKLLVITAVAAFENDIKKMLKQAQVKGYSYQNVKGYIDISEKETEDNWFGSEMNENESVVFYAFLDQQHVDTFFDLAAVFNEQQESLSKIHIASFEVEKHN